VGFFSAKNRPARVISAGCYIGYAQEVINLIINTQAVELINATVLLTFVYVSIARSITQ